MFHKLFSPPEAFFSFGGKKITMAHQITNAGLGEENSTVGIGIQGGGSGAGAVSFDCPEKISGSADGRGTNDMEIKLDIFACG